MQDPSFTIRAPREDDVEALVELHVQTWRETYAHLLPADFFSAEHRAQRRAQWSWLVANPAPQRVPAVAEAEGTLIGLALAGPPLDPGDAPHDLLLNMLYVLRTRHGTGVGQALLDAVVGSRPAFLWVSQDNLRAQAFYRRNGFSPDGTEVLDEMTHAFVDLRMVR